MSRPLGVIDIGSNTIRSLIVEPQADGGYRILDDEREVVRLASGLDQRKRLSAAAMERALVALRRMAGIARARRVQRMAVVATSALRTASNRSVFVARALREAGLRVRVISGDEEAQLAFESAALSFPLDGQPCAVVDVGGGSTEVIVSLGRHIQRVYSLHLGSVPLTEEFLRSDPIRSADFKCMRKAIREVLTDAKVTADIPPRYLIASGGTASTIAQAVLASQGMVGRSVQGHELSQAEVLHLREVLRALPLARRRQTPGISPDRADIIVAGVSILYEIMAALKVNTMKVSTRGIRHALVHRMMGRARPKARALRAAPVRVAAARTLARALRSEPAHADQVQRLALSLFDQLAPHLRLDPGWRDLLAAAALLHDVGYMVSFQQHHKHTYHLIAHAQLDGFSPTEREVIAQVARYHRRSPPRKKHVAWAALSPARREAVRQLAAILRVADALDRRHTQPLRELRCQLRRGRVLISLESDGELEVEIHAAREKGTMFQEVFGLPLEFERAAVPRRRILRSAPRRGAAAESRRLRPAARRGMRRAVRRR
jgi:exopolyphosphatase/guanosine-5'-triphosphate,3'-diphosphate pyrophosphatase